ncbi:MAG: cell division protein FtsZ [Holosporaceae bacterium]|jgi:cell division protein FtsZ|nr:cell division protein FtsZ [Holosporaceae bacterium]
MAVLVDTINRDGRAKQGDFFVSDDNSGIESLKPKIMVFGVGGAGGNAVNNMIKSKLEGVEFVVANTDAQALLQSLSERRIQLGLQITSGLGAGARPDIGKAAAEEAIDEIISYIRNSNMVFITAGMGGGTGTGAAPVIARLAKEEGVLTIGVITKPFHFEGTNRMRTAEKGIEELQQFVDTLIVIPNQNLFRIANEKTTFADAFKMADDVLRSGVQGVTDLMVMPGLINLDFADIRTVMSEMGKAMMGTGDAEGERRSIEAAEAAISNPLLDDVSMKGARGILINITGGYDLTLYEVDEAANRIREEVDPEARIIFGSTFNDKMNGRMRVSVVATGIDAVAVQQKKQAFDEISSTKLIKKDVVSPEIADLKQNAPFVPDHQSEKQQQTAAPLGTISNDYINRNNDYENPRKKSPSLFERLTGMKRFSSTKKDDPTISLIKNTPASQQPLPRAQEEDLEIPAFLRRGS